MTTPDQILEVYAHLPWTIFTSAEDGHFVAYVTEMPDAIADGATEAELRVALDEAIRESLLVRLAAGDSLPLPHGVGISAEGNRPTILRGTSNWSVSPAAVVAAAEPAWA